MTHETHTRPPPKALFMFPLEMDMKPRALRDTQTAYEFSKHGHAKQIRDDGTRYFDHPKMVAWIYINEYGGRSRRLIIDFLLHDMLEDSFLLTPFNIKRLFGKKIACDIRALTKLPRGKETTEQYLQRVIEQGPHAIAGKLFDRLHNTRTLADVTDEKRVSQIKETEEYHLPMLITALEDCGEKWAKMAGWLEANIFEAITHYED